MKIPNPFKPPPAPAGFGAGKVLPEVSASLLSRLVFQWLSPFLDVGFSRPLEKEDFWELPPSRLTGVITNEIEANFYARCAPESRPVLFRERRTSSSSIVVEETEKALEVRVTEKKTESLDQPAMNDSASKKYDASLFKSIHKTFFYQIWIAGILLLLSETLKTITPLLNKVILTWLADSYTYHHLPVEESAALGLEKPRGIGYGIGLAVALFVMQEAASLMANHYMILSMATGLYVRTGIIGSIFRKSLRLSGRARTEHSVGQITTMISTDSTRLDLVASNGHHTWVSPIQLIIGIGLLIGNLGYSALVGLGVLIIGLPIQGILVAVMFKQRKKGVKITDRRVQLTTEVLQGIRLIKIYSWEAFYMRQITNLRKQEIRRIRKFMIALSMMVTLVTFIPTLGAVLSFITYGLSGHDLNIAIIFSSLQLFNIIRAPLVTIPFVLSGVSDALVALSRISKFLQAEELEEPYKIQEKQETAIEADGDFAWEATPVKEAGEEKFSRDGDGFAGPTIRTADKKKADNGDKKSSEKSQGAKKKRWWSKANKGGAEILPISHTGELERKEDTLNLEEESEKPFELKQLQLSIPTGSFVVIVGRVGSGKSSVLQALLGEMRRTRGNVTFGGTVAYVPQTPWIRNATLRENVTFGEEDKEDRFREVIKACNLTHDLEVLPHAEETEIGEKGINLSGGQKARVSLARAAYSQSDIVLLDDPLSAVDAYVGKSILDQCLLSGPLSGRTRVLVTHALHVFDKADYVYVMDKGAIIEQGTYKDLIAKSTVFSCLIEEFGSIRDDEKPQSQSKREKNDGTARYNFAMKDKDSKEDAVLMQAEERETGAVPWHVYKKYLRFAGGISWAPLIILFLLLNQGIQVFETIFLGLWTANSINGFTQGQYMAVYAGINAANALSSFVLIFSFASAGLIGSLNLFTAALFAVLRSATSFFDTTPMGRVLSRLSKDQDTLDTALSLTMYLFLATFSSILGTVALVFYTFPLLGIIFAPMALLYCAVALYYRRSSIECKRLDSLMRSALYASYSETLTGLSTIRAYMQQGRSIKDAERGLDMENRAFYMTVAIQRWLAVRLDFFGNILIFGIGLFAVGFRDSVNPSKIGVVLTYALSITQVFSEMISQFAQNEQNMNAVERVLHYSELPPEGEAVAPNDPPPSWPEKGEITFSNVELAYREGLPLVLKGVTFQINPGEKVGIVGRTGSGKSSLLQALFRIVELQSGKIEIDGLNIRNIGLDTLRSRLALVPQESTLFLGTLRDNLDPLNLRTDAELITVLQRAWLLPGEGSPDPVAEAKFSLDSAVGDDGANFSAGEKQLLSLCRALVKNSKIIVLDEATSSVDVETDSKLQRTIQTEFASSTLLCIAHRLNTIAYYDRVIVMDAGEVVEYDTVLNLFDNPHSFFRSLCNEANLQRSDILKIRADNSTNDSNI